jgi:integrase/recombinase XerD
MKGARNSNSDQAKQPDQGGGILPLPINAEALLPASEQESLVAWMNLYIGLEAGASSDNTFKAKRRDLECFLAYFRETIGSDHPDQWTRSLTSSFLKLLERTGKKATTVNRILATIRHAASWIHRKRPFLAGNPTGRIAEFRVDDPEWKGLTDQEVTRLRCAAEQLLHLKGRLDQNPLRDYAIFLVLLHTGLRVSELLSLDLDQYQGKHFQNVKRKGRKVSRHVFLAKEPREALDRYIHEVRKREPGPLIQSRSRERLARQNVDDILKEIAHRASTRFPKEHKIRLSAHVLRHTMLRRAAEKYGVQYAMELAGHTSSQYIWRYVKPTDDQKEKAIEDLF